MDINYRTLGKLERGDSRLRWEVAQKAANALNCSPFELVPEGAGLGDLQLEALRLMERMSREDAERWLKIGDALLKAAEDHPISETKHKVA